MASLHEGLFFSQAQAEAYVSVFQPATEDVRTGGVFEIRKGTSKINSFILIF